MRFLDSVKDRIVAAVERRVLPKAQEMVRAELRAFDRPKPFIPGPGVVTVGRSEPFMTTSSCSARDFFHPRFKELWDALHVDQPYFLHRKYWEWVYIANALSPLCKPGARGLGFAVGSTETLAAYFASLGARITASDAPAEIGIGSGWQKGGEFAVGFDALPYKDILPFELMKERVEYREVDMNAIPADLHGYDFCWSSCSLEHLGTLEAGLDFVVNSVENTLKVGGVACHTTELNLSSNNDTVESGATVIYRQRDLQRLIDTLRSRGHHVQDLMIAPDSLAIEGYVDTPPYGPPLHLKLQLMGYVCTSVAVIVTRGR
jgi:hypothetical protein